ncbi:DUF3800 domain-containing protein [Xylophilus sp. Leaf220]|uniref:DUF3800 domain-containing protein n=1 Tax=Xylophilus sp. Leaf220 TaxID=1735686 RepID=UPI0006F365E2|nr:DUF3800 domain-containing protein [Xylophilus sp. Leaf220]KQM79467.1 3-deoxy-D-manno-octulosonic acid transferase [Xylophilus sp. Leaf220]
MPSSGTQYALFESVEPTPVEQAQPERVARRFSDYVVYVDESGDHSLASIDKDYPVFVLALCIFHKRHYAEKIVPAVEKLKFNYFGHDSVVLHENEIRKQKGDFAFLAHRPTRDAFMAGLTSIMEASNFILVACVVDKARVNRAAGAASNPYHIALGMGLEALRSFLAEKGQDAVKTHVVVECRGKKEDAELELEFRRICDGDNPGNRGLPFDVVFADKKTNLAGLQLADLVARPVGLHYLRPAQPNQAFELLKKKFLCDGDRAGAGAGFEDIGLVIYPPQKAKSPGGPTEAVAPTRNPQST